MDADLNAHMKLTSANSINVARFLPQAFYYFYAYAQLKKEGKADHLVVCVPSGNFGNITAGLFGKRMGLPVKRFIAANNRNDIFYQYLQTGKYNPRPSIATIANAMDVGDPSNFARVLALYGNSHAAITADISGATYTDEQIRETVGEVYRETGYLLDPRMEPAVIVLYPKDCPPAKRVFSWKRHIRLNSWKLWKASLETKWRFPPNCKRL